MVQTFRVNKNNKVIPIEWQKYTGEEIILNTIIRKGKRIEEKAFYEDKVKAVPVSYTHLTLPTIYSV